MPSWYSRDDQTGNNLKVVTTFALVDIYQDSKYRNAPIFQVSKTSSFLPVDSRVNEEEKGGGEGRRRNS